MNVRYASISLRDVLVDLNFTVHSGLGPSNVRPVGCGLDDDGRVGLGIHRFLCETTAAPSSLLSDDVASLDDGTPVDVGLVPAIGGLRYLFIRLGGRAL